MIEKMRKFSFFIFEPEYSSFLRQLKALGVVHIKNNTDPQEIERIKAINEEIEDITRLKSRLSTIKSNYPLEKGQSPDSIPHDGVEQSMLLDYPAYLRAISETDDRIRDLQKELTHHQQQYRELEAWGDFDPALIAKLTSAGYSIQFWTVLKSQYNPEWEELYDLEVITTAGRSVYFITVTKDGISPDLEYAEKINLPKSSLSELQVAMNTTKALLKSEQDMLAYLAFHTYILDQKEVELKNEYNLDNAYYQGNRLYDDKLVILEGWVPEPKAEALEHSLDELDIAYTELAFSDTEDVPIQLTNNRFTRAFEPLVKMFSLPNYNEFDPTPFIAPFFMLFFGICFGDAGYGILLLIAATIFKGKVKPDLKPTVELVQYLGLAGIVIGFFSGSFFGIELVKVPFLASIKEFFIDSNNMMVISLALGLIQIIFAKYVAAFKKKTQSGLSASLSSFAWPTLIVMVLLLVGLPMINISLPTWAEYILWGISGACVLIALLWNSPGKNIFLNIGSGLWETYNVASGLLGDTLSYIRLFAIGLTGAILGQVFNSLAMQVTTGVEWYIAFPVGLIILLIGHTINFGLTMISALVHPIRLTYVEYFNNAEYEGGGKPYNPLKQLSLEEESRD